jgi:hypothetical protein
LEVEALTRTLLIARCMGRLCRARQAGDSRRISRMRDRFDSAESPEPIVLVGLTSTRYGGARSGTTHFLRAFGCARGRLWPSQGPGR